MHFPACDFPPFLFCLSTPPSPLLACLSHGLSPHTIPPPHSVNNERNILALANNPFVVRFYYSFTSRENLYIVMEYLNGGDCFRSASSTHPPTHTHTHTHTHPA